MIFKKESNIDKLARKKKELMLKKEKIQRDMRERNSKRETKISILENASQTDYENVQKRVVQLTRELDKVIRDMESEKIYVNEVADAEKKEFLQSQKEEQSEKQLKKGIKTE